MAKIRKGSTKLNRIWRVVPIILTTITISFALPAPSCPGAGVYLYPLPPPSLTTPSPSCADPCDNCCQPGWQELQRPTGSCQPPTRDRKPLAGPKISGWPSERAQCVHQSLLLLVVHFPCTPFHSPCMRAHSTPCMHAAQPSLLLQECPAGPACLPAWSPATWSWLSVPLSWLQPVLIQTHKMPLSPISSNSTGSRNRKGQEYVLRMGGRVAPVVIKVHCPDPDWNPSFYRPWKALIPPGTKCYCELGQWMYPVPKTVWNVQECSLVWSDLSPSTWTIWPGVIWDFKSIQFENHVNFLNG